MGIVSTGSLSEKTFNSNLIINLLKTQNQITGRFKIHVLSLYK